MSEQFDTIQGAVLGFDAMQAGIGRAALLNGIRDIAEHTEETKRDGRCAGG